MKHPLRAFRRKNKISVSDLAKALGKPNRFVHAIENGVLLVKFETASCIENFTKGQITDEILRGAMAHCYVQE